MSTGERVVAAVRFQPWRLLFWLLVLVVAVVVGTVLQFGLPDQVVAIADAIPRTGDPPWCGGTQCR